MSEELKTLDWLTSTMPALAPDIQGPRLYHLDIRRKDGTKKQITGYPMLHGDCMTMKSKFTAESQSRIELRDIGRCPHSGGFFQFEAELRCRTCMEVKP